MQLPKLIKVSLLLSLLALGPASAQTTAAEYNSQGITKSNNGDRLGGITDYTKAIALDPGFVEAYTNRGHSYKEVGNYEAAMADFDKALTLKPDDWYTLSYRAELKHLRGDFDGAIADFSEVLEIVPMADNAYTGRAAVRLDKGQVRAATADYSKLIKLAPKAWSYHLRGSALIIGGNFSRALADYETCISLTKEESEKAYPQITRYLLLRRLNRPDARAELVQAVPHWPDDWGKSVASYLLGDLPEEKFFAKAAQGQAKSLQGQQCEAFYYAGMNRILAGDPAAAVFFEKCVATNLKDFSEYSWARAELKRSAKP